MNHLLYLIFLLLFSVVNGEMFAVIMVGSAGYINYRHHADGCHAYKLLRKSNISENNIITLMYDNVAYDSQNPFPGRLFNVPSDKEDPGIDVYQGTKKDYTGNTVTAANFLNVLSGNKSAVPKNFPVLKTGSKDRIFIAYFDHGGDGILGTPSGPYLTREAFLKTLNYMYRKKLYKEMVIFVEACESGSMFENMSSDRNIYVLTASTPNEPSYGDYCPEENQKGNDWVYYNNTYREINSCLGDTFSNMWMANLKNFMNTNETLYSQFLKVKQATTTSTVSRYGTLSISNMTIKSFE